MRISFLWLKQHVTLADSITPKMVADALKLSTVEVEWVEHLGANLEGVVVGHVEKVDKHPQADRLQVCSVRVGKKELVQIVCGGSNVVEKMDVLVALPGAKVRWHGEGDPIVLQNTTIRGVESCGMICASDEIGLASRFPKNSEKEIVDITNFKIKPGTSATVALGLNDAILHIDNKTLSHRSDLWGHYGIAREVAALFHRAVKPLDVPKIISSKEKGVHVKNVESMAALRYMAVRIDGVSAVPSTDNMQQALSAVDIISKNILVDVTNYVMHDIGQPLHVFDADKVQGTIVVRMAKERETLLALNDVIYKLTPEMAVIADDTGPIALAGIIGGKNTAVSDSTTSIVLEAATFGSVHIRRTSTVLGIRTDASARFEKTLDTELCEIGLARAVSVIQNVCTSAHVVGKVFDSFPKKKKPVLVDVPHVFLETLLGLQLTKQQVLGPLENLGFACKKNVKGVYTIEVPSFRSAKDVTIKEDIAEEVLRLNGFDAVEASMPVVPMTPVLLRPRMRAERLLRNTLSNVCAYTEVYLYSFVSEENICKIGDSNLEYLALQNPVAKDRPFLRRSLLPNMLDVVEQALHTKKNVCIYEIGKVFLLDESGERAEPGSDELLPRQDTYLGVVCAGQDDAVEQVLHATIHSLSTAGYSASVVDMQSKERHAHPGRVAQIVVSGTVVGSVYEVHPKIRKDFGIAPRVAYASVNITTLVGCDLKQTTFVQVPVYPVVERDISFVIDFGVRHVDIVNVLQQADNLVRSVCLFDLFTGKDIPDGKKSMAYRLNISAEDRTLTSEEVDACIKNVEDALKKEYTVVIRS